MQAKKKQKRVALSCQPVFVDSASSSCFLYRTMISDLLAPPKKKSYRSKGLGQAYELRDISFKLARELGQITVKEPKDVFDRARAVTSVTKSWAEADDRIRIHTGKPLPGTLRPEKRSQAKSERSIPEPAQRPVKPAPSVTEADTPAEPLCVPKSSSKAQKATSEEKGL